MAAFRIYYCSDGKTKESVRRRDGWRCVDCGESGYDHGKRTGMDLHVHRLIRHTPYAGNTCVTVCKECHSKRHRKNRDKRDSIEDSMYRMTELVQMLSEALAGRYGLQPHELVERLLSRRRRAKIKERKTEFVYEG